MCKFLTAVAGLFSFIAFLHKLFYFVIYRLCALRWLWQITNNVRVVVAVVCYAVPGAFNVCI